MDRASKLSSLLVIVLGFCILGILYKSNTLILIGCGVGVAGLVSKLILKYIIYVWNKIAEILGFINSRILLSVIFYIFLFPIAFFARLSSKNMLQLKNVGDSVYAKRDKKYTKEDLEDLW